MTVYVNQTFTGTNGATPGNLIGGVTPTGGGVVIQANTARFTSGATGGYSGNDRVERAVSSDGTTALSLADLDMTFDFVPVSGEQFPQFVFRSPYNTWTGRTGYYVTADYDRVTLNYSEDWTGNPLATTLDFTSSSSATYRILAVGTSLQVYINGTLKLSATDSRFSSGYILLGTTGGSTAGTRGVMTIDNLVVKDAATLDLAGSASSASSTTGALTQLTTVLALAGSAVSASSTAGAISAISNAMSGSASSASSTTGALKIVSAVNTGARLGDGTPLSIRLGNGTPLSMRVVGASAGVYGAGTYGSGIYGN